MRNAGRSPMVLHLYQTFSRLTVHAVPHPSFSLPKALGKEKSTFPPGEGLGRCRASTWNDNFPPRLMQIIHKIDFYSIYRYAIIR